MLDVEEVCSVQHTIMIITRRDSASFDIFVNIHRSLIDFLSSSMQEIQIYDGNVDKIHIN